MSREYSTVVTRKGQITIPAEVRRALGLSEGDRVAIVVGDDRQVCLTRTAGAVVRTAGMLKSDNASLSAQALRQAGERAIADEASERQGA